MRHTWHFWNRSGPLPSDRAVFWLPTCIVMFGHRCLCGTSQATPITHPPLVKEESFWLADWLGLAGSLSGCFGLFWPVAGLPGCLRTYPPARVPSWPASGQYLPGLLAPWVFQRLQLPKWSSAQLLGCWLFAWLPDRLPSHLTICQKRGEARQAGYALLHVQDQRQTTKPLASTSAGHTALRRSLRMLQAQRLDRSGWQTRGHDGYHHYY